MNLRGDRGHGQPSLLRAVTSRSLELSNVMRRLFPYPEVDLAEGSAAGGQVVSLPDVVVFEPFPPLVRRLELSPEAPSVLVVDGHDVGGVGGGEAGSVADDEEVLVICLAGLWSQVVGTGEHHGVHPERIN